MFCHLVARTRFAPIVLDDHVQTTWLWQHLQCAFPDALACVLMPDHLHLLARVADTEQARITLASLLGHDSRRRRAGVRLWSAVPQPKIVADVDKLRRELRYIVLNPCRKRLVHDPVAWLWSSYRDVLGAVAHPWIHVDRLRAALDLDESRGGSWLHTYVSSDPSVHSGGTSLPRAAAPRRLAVVPLSEIARAAAIATRSRADAVAQHGPARKLFVALAHHQGWTDNAELARACNVHPSTVRRLVHAVDPTELRAAALCLGDERLLRPTCPSRANNHVR